MKIDPRQGNFWAGAGLVALGVIDGAFNPFGFVTAPELFTAGIALMVASQSIPSSDKDRDKDQD